MFGNHVSLVSSSLAPLLCLSSSLVTWHFLCLIFSDLDTLEDIAQLFCRKYCIWGLLMFAHGETEVVCCWEKHPEAAPSPRVSCWGAWCPRIIPVRLP